jgi:uncharacterized membrane protein
MTDKPVRRGKMLSPPSLVGLAVGLVPVGLSFTPSLLPRPFVMQGVITGICVALGYAIGVFIAWVMRRLTKWEPAPRVRRIAWIAVLVATVAVIVASVSVGESWQNEVRRLVEMAPITWTFMLKAIPVAALMAALLVIVGRALRAATRGLARLLGRRLPPWAGLSIGGVIVALLVVVLLVAGFKGFEKLTKDVYGKKNATTAEGVVQPQSAARSGSSASLVSWQSLGMQGRNFVGRGPTVAQLQAFNGKPPKEPIRVYVGLDSAPTAEARAAVAVSELERTGAFTRKLLVVMGCTGTGWIEPQSADPPEFMYNGDTAEVTIQYSFLPSWISTITDKADASSAGKALFNAVYATWSKLPAGSRPKLIAYGLSLGSFACQAALTGAQDLRDRTDGAFFSGTPNFSQPWRAIEDTRDAGSPEWLPIYEKGATVRFAAAPKYFSRPASPWNDPRVLYLQHGSDPVVWWSQSLFLHQPDWLKEPRAPDVSPQTTWFPVVTFLQVTVDQFYGTTVPNGYGHNYGNMSVDAWSAIAPPPGWTAQRAQELQAAVDKYRIE